MRSQIIGEGNIVCFIDILSNNEMTLYSDLDIYHIKDFVLKTLFVFLEKGNEFIELFNTK
jgi:hypothetical protein